MLNPPPKIETKTMIIIHLLLIEVFGGLGLGAKVALGVTDVRKAVV